VSGRVTNSSAHIADVNDVAITHELDANALLLSEISKLCVAVARDVQWSTHGGREFSPTRQVIRMDVGLSNRNDSHIMAGGKIRVDVYIALRVDDKCLTCRLIAYDV
jgi:hypothetical protein